ncbi:unnamed protein product [Tetraodon nigroviridis]|uniref:(spotted green pufferfish) hypothetical protein n=1 Tax=Tetraodon nigroviridis TaxID=99883 RepID=Q4SYX4_TETNG|nr:unnamed protein product [Tetraodon nigroviridis]
MGFINKQRLEEGLVLDRDRDRDRPWP